MVETLLNIGFDLLGIGIKIFVITSLFVIAIMLISTPLIIIGAIFATTEDTKLKEKKNGLG